MSKHACIICSSLVVILLTCCEISRPPEISIIKGQVSLPSGVGLTASDLDIQAGVNGNAKTDLAGNFSIDAEIDGPVLAVATTPAGSPILLNVLDPRSNSNDLNMLTTARALVFMGLGIYSGDPSLFTNILACVESLTEVQQLAILLSQKIAADPNVLAEDPPDNQIAEAVDSAMGAALQQITIDDIMPGPFTSRSVTPYVVPSYSQSWLAITVDKDCKATAKNLGLRFVRTTINGPNAKDQVTLVPPASFPLCSPSTTILNPIPLSQPSGGVSYLYEVRATGGLKNDNGMYDRALDEESLMTALTYSFVFDFALPIVKIGLGIAGLSQPLPIEVVIADDLIDILGQPLMLFRQGIIDGIENQNLDIYALFRKLVPTVLSTLKQNIPVLAKSLQQSFYNKIPQEALETTLRNTLSNAFEICPAISIGMNGAKLIIGINDIVKTNRVEKFILLLESSPKITISKSFDGDTTGIPPSGWSDTYENNMTREEAQTQGVTIRVDDKVFWGSTGKSVHFLDTSTSIGSQLILPIARLSTMTVDYYMLTKETGYEGNIGYEGVFVALVGDAGTDYAVCFRPWGYIGIHGWNGGWVQPTLMTCQANTWYHVVRTLDLETSTGSFYVEEVNNPSNHGSYSIGSNYANNYVDSIIMVSSTSQGADAFIDEVKISGSQW